MHCHSRLSLLLFAFIALTITASPPDGHTELAPTAFTEAARLATNLTGDGYGNGQVAISGDTAVVSSSAGFYVYVRSAAGWAEQTVLVPSDGMGVTNNVRSVAISGDTLVIGGPLALVNGTNAGAAYVFVRNGSTWTEQRLTASDGQAADNFGFVVSISGESIIVSAARDDIGTSTDQGSAYVFVRQAGVWNEQAKLLALDGGTGELFGARVMIDGDSAVLAVSRTGINQMAAVYVFVRSGTSWSQQQKISVCEPSINNQCSFGLAFAIDGNTLVIGNPNLNVGNQSGAGGVYVFGRNGTVWTQQQPRITPVDALQDDGFGSSIAFREDTLVVGAPAFNVRTGSVYVYSRAEGNWTIAQPRIQTISQTVSNIPAQWLSLDGNSFVFGVARDMGTPESPQGAAYIYSDGTTPTPTPTATPTNTPTATPTNTPTATPTNTPTATPTATPTNTPTATPTATPTGTPTATPTATPTNTPTATPTNTPTATSTNTPTATPTVTPKNTPTNTPTATPTATPVGRTVFDYDGDRRSDISVFRPSTGAWYLQQSTAGTYGVSFGVSTDQIAPADYDGDNKTDIAVYRPSTGIWYITNSSNGSVRYEIFGLAEDLTTPADYDGDGKADISVFRPSSGTWYRINSSDGSFTAAQFGTNGDKPTIGDFDGDGNADVAVFRPSTGAWYQTYSANGSFFGEQFGISSDKVAPADYDGDGKTDIAIYRPSEGLWYVKNSATTTYRPYVFGLAEDIPVPADFDGDGEADIGVFRPADGTWYIVNSSNGSYTIQQFGTAGDRPTQSAFAN